MVSEILREPDRVHAVLLAGQEGSGAQSLAHLLAKGWLCKSSESRPCGECGPCKSMAAGSCVDFQLIEPTGASRNILIRAIVPVKPDSDDAKTIPISQFFRTRPLVAERKVVTIQDADRLNARAFNALLKILEEPPSYAKLILTTDSISRIAPTILSRCLVLICDLPSQDEIQQTFGDLSEAERLFGEGAPERIATIRQHCELYDQILSQCESLKFAQAGSALKCAEEFRSLGEQLGEAMNIGNRQGNAEVLRIMGIWWSRYGTGRDRGLDWIAEAHRYVIGNANAPAVFDALFTRLLTLD